MAAAALVFPVFAQARPLSPGSPLIPDPVPHGFLSDPQPPERVLAGYAAFLREQKQYDPALVQVVLQEVDQLAGQIPDAGFITAACARLSPDFNEGLKLINHEQTAAAADRFEKLAQSRDPYLALAAARLAAAALIELNQVERCDALLRGVFEEYAPFETYSLDPGWLHFYVGYCQIHDLDYGSAYVTLMVFLRRYPDAPERLRTAARQMAVEMEARRPGTLGDVRDLMDYSRRRLAQRNMDQKLLARQDQAVELLNTLIEQAEQQEQQGGGDQNNGGGQSPQNRQARGASRSQLPAGADQEAELRATRARPGEAWGKMPAGERERVLQSLQDRFPSQYRELIEQYYKELALESAGP